MTEQENVNPVEPGDATAPDDPAVAGDIGQDGGDAGTVAQEPEPTSVGAAPPPITEGVGIGETDDTALEAAASGDEPHGQEAQEAAGGVAQAAEPAGVGAQEDPAAHDSDTGNAGASPDDDQAPA